MALQIYDVELDKNREATQADIDALQAAANAYAALRRHVAEVHENLMLNVAQLRQRAAVSERVDRAMDDAAAQS